MTQTSYPTTNTEGRNVTVAGGKLNFLPSRKGEEIYLDGFDLLTILRQYDGKEIQIVIQELGWCSSDVFSDITATTISESNAELGIRRSSSRGDKDE